MMKRIKNLLIILVCLLLFIFFYIFEMKWNCPFKKMFHIACPGCGLTRSFISLINLDVISSIKYNILGIPIAIFVFISIVFLIKDFIKNEANYIEYIYSIFNKYYMYILILIIIIMIINNVNNV